MFSEVLFYYSFVLCFLCVFRYLASGDSFTSLAYSYRVGKSTVGKIVEEVCCAIWDCLVEEFMPVPTREDWREIAEGFRRRWNFPNCLGAIDGKHVVIQAPRKSGSMFWNYKGSHSIVLLAIVDAEYCFRMVDVGGYGRNSDGGTLSNSAFGEALRDGKLDLPEDQLIPGAEGRGEMPHVFVGDEAFPLRRNLLRPFPGKDLTRERRIFNYRLSRARLTVECAFGILASQWRIYRRLIAAGPKKVEACVKATCILHNYIRMTRNTNSIPLTSNSEEEAAGLLEAQRTGTNNAARERYSAYFNNEGAVPWQHNV